MKILIQYETQLKWIDLFVTLLYGEFNLTKRNDIAWYIVNSSAEMYYR